MYRVIEVAKILGVSKVTIYKKMERLKKELKPFIHKRSNITYIDEGGLEILKSHIEKTHISSNENMDYIDLKQQSNADLEIIVSALNEQIVSKKKQYDNNERIIDSMKLMISNNELRVKVIEEKLKLRS